MVASTSSSTWTRSYSSRQHHVPFGGSLYFLSGFLSHLLNLSLLRHNLLPLMFDVMLHHNHVISACNQLLCLLCLAEVIKTEFVEFMLSLPCVHTRHVCC